MNTELGKKAKNDFEKYFPKLINNIVFGETMRNMKKNIEISSLQQTKKEGISQRQNHGTVFFFKSISHRKNRNSLSLDLSILALNKIVMY